MFERNESLRKGGGPVEGNNSYISPLPSARWNSAFPRPLTILGSTGSIGVSALRVLEAHPGRFRLVALAGGGNVELLATQARRFQPEWLAVRDAGTAERLQERLGPDAPRFRIVHGREGYAHVASLPDINTVLSAQSGAAGLYATMAAVVGGKVVCLANKESLVLAGDVLRSVCTRSGASILPVDSEHNALFQLIRGREHELRRVCITASGGPFRGWTPERLATVSPEAALNHPKWCMGPKISIDSATLMNKGLEIIEACRLYGLPPDRVHVLVHPQALVHAMVEFTDGSFTAHLGMPDMRMPIAHCLLWPEVLDCGVQRLDLARAGSLTFEEPDLFSFPCLPLAQKALTLGVDACVRLNAANEVAVAAFLAGRIGFTDIAGIIADTLDLPPARTASADVTASVPDGLRDMPGADEAFAAVARIDAMDQAAREAASGLVQLGSR